MRVFLAGATGVIGIRLIPLLIADGHAVAGMTRSVAKTDQLRELGAHPVLCDVFDVEALVRAVTSFKPDAVIHQLTDLPDRLEDIGSYASRNDRIRTEGTRNLLHAAQEAGASRFLAQSIAWRPAGRTAVIDDHEGAVLQAGGVVVRYGQFYGPGTYYEDDKPFHPRIHIDEAARATPPLIQHPSGIVTIAET
jgi:Nucleoside-diphosphate-sugar epimerases